MPRGGPLRQILSTCSVTELQSIHAEYCPQVGEYDGDKQAFEGRLRDSLHRSVEQDKLSYVDLIEYIRGEITDEDNRRVTLGFVMLQKG